MERDWLVRELELGKSFEQIGRDIGLHGSTVAYWAKKHGLRSVGAARLVARGAPDRSTLEKLAATGATLSEMAASLDRSMATIRYWLKKWRIQRSQRATRRPKDPSNAPSRTILSCRRHGLTMFQLDRVGRYRCLRCRAENVSEWRRRLKRQLVREAGGKCTRCGSRPVGGRTPVPPP